LKSLQKVIELLRQDIDQNEALEKVNFGGIVDERVNVKQNEVGNACMNNSANYTGNSYENYSNIVTNNNEVLDLFKDTRHRVNSKILPVSVSNPKTNSKTILQVNSSAKW
jgi:hypothetical protein